MIEPRSSLLHRVRLAAGSVRVRTTLGAAAIVGLALLLVGLLLVSALRDSLVNDRLEVAEARADEIVALVEAAEDRPPLEIPGADDELVQVLDADGSVIAGSHNAAGAPPIARLAVDGSAEIVPGLGDEASYIAFATGAETANGQLTVIVARGLDDVADSTLILAQLLAVGLPALLVVVGLTTWLVVGRALAPVEAIRSEVEAISAQELHRRVPEPRHGDEISRLATTMNRMLGRLQESQVRQQRFVSDAAHELRSPIASIRQHAEVAIAHPDRVAVGELAETVLAEDLRMQSVVNDLLLLARTDERVALAAYEEVDLDDIVLEEAGRLRSTTRLQVDTSAVSGGRVRGDVAWLRRMVRNLVDNAARHARSHVSLSLGQQLDGTVVLRVDDDGPGIPAPDRERIFQRFVRLDAARGRDDGGSGLGLSIVAEVAAAHGGAAAAGESAAGGARLEVHLPAAAD